MFFFAASGNGTAFVENQKLVFNVLDERPSSPATAYPFTRLAWLNGSEDTESTYFYHQVSDAILVEDSLDDTGWYSTNISIGPSN